MIVTSLLAFAALVESPFTPDTPTQRVSETLSMAPAACDAKLRLRGEKAERAASNAKPKKGLPESYGRSFRSLEAYLIHLQCHAAPVDAAWWKEIRPGVYKHMTTATNAPPNEIATRAELMKRFGFSQ